MKFSTYLEKLRCQKLKNASWAIDGTNQSQSIGNGSTGLRCPPTYDKSLCWDFGLPGETHKIECPLEFCSHCQLEERHATKFCSLSGEWSPTNYDTCRYIYTNRSDCVAKRCIPCPDLFWDWVKNLILSLCVISVVLLVLCLIIFSAYRSLQCARNSMHKHLTVSFVVRFSTFIVWLILQRYQFFYGCAGPKPEQVEWLCKVMVALIAYSALASMHWMFVEGAYLTLKLTCFAMTGDGSQVLWWLFGWGLPVVWVAIWVGVLETSNTGKFCWLPYTKSNSKWVVLAPMLTCLAINCVLLVVIVVTVLKKINAENVHENRRLWKTVKATLLLVPLLGVANLLFLVEPGSENTIMFHVFIVLQAIMEHSQGIVIAVLYCFTNNDVREAIARSIKQNVWVERFRNSSAYKLIPAKRTASNLVSTRNSVVSTPVRAEGVLLVNGKSQQEATL